MRPPRCVTSPCLTDETLIAAQTGNYDGYGLPCAYGDVASAAVESRLSAALKGALVEQ